MKKIKEKKSIKLNIFLGFCLTIVTFFLIINIIPPKKVVDHNPFVIKEGSKPLIAAHRGGKYLNPENTLKAINIFTSSSSKRPSFCLLIISVTPVISPLLL